MKYVASIIGLLFASASFADTRQQIITIPIEIDHNGQIIVRIALFDSADGKSHEFRMLFDTGTTLTIFDEGLPESFYFKVPRTAQNNMVDATGAQLQFESIVVKRFEFGNVRRDNFAVSRYPLRNSIFGRMQDNPADGILGMDVLRGLRFVLDVPKKQLRLWDSLDASHLGISYSNLQLPYLPMYFGSEDFNMILDSGSDSGFTFTHSKFNEIEGEPFNFGGIGDLVKQGKKVNLGKLDFPDAPWQDLSVDVIDPNDGFASIGRYAMSGQAVEFDFIQNQIAFEKPKTGQSYVMPRPPLLPIFSWDRSTSKPLLSIEKINPSGLEYSLGFRANDQIVAIGTATTNLTIAQARLAASGKAPLVWKVLREGKTIEISHPGRP